MIGAALAVAGSVALAQNAPATATAVERVLAPGTRAEQPLSPGEVHSYSVALEEGRFLRLAVVQDGIDVVLTLSGPSGPPVEIDVPDGRFGPEPASLLPSAGGTYRLTVRAKTTRGSVPGRYAVETEAPRPATAEDQTRAAAERSLVDAAALIRAGQPAAAKAALDKLEEALGRWRALADRRGEADTLAQRALAHLAARDHARTLVDAAAAASLWREIGDGRGQAGALMTAAIAHQASYQYERAIESFNQALVLRRAAGDRQEQADLLWRLRIVYRDLADTAGQLEVAREALALFRALPSSTRGDREGEVSALGAMASARVNSGDLEGGLADFRAAVAVAREMGDAWAAATQLQNVGAIYQELGDPAGAAAAYLETLPTIEAGHQDPGSVTAGFPTRAYLPNVYQNLGHAYSLLGDSKTAREYFAKALPLKQELGERWAASTLIAMGRESNTVGEYEKAAGELEAALKVALEASDLANEAYARGQLGRARLELGQTAEARAHLERAADLGRSLGDTVREADALQLLARLANDTGDLVQARRVSEAALGVLEARRHRLTSPRLRSTAAAATREAYELHVDVLMGLHRQQPEAGFDARALEASEQARARGLADALSQAGLDVREGADPALLARERVLRDRLSAALDRQLRLSKAPQEVAEGAARQVQLLSGEWDELQAALKAGSPRFVELRDPPPPSTASIRNDVLDEDTVLVEYALGAKRSFVWVVSREGLTAHELPGRAVINEAARQAYTALAELGSRTSGRPGEAQGALARLSGMVLAPAADALRARRLLVVADGALHYVPFAALPHPRGSGEPLVATHEVVSAPSASVLPLLRRDRVRAHRPARTVVVVADPVFQRDDPRVPGSPRRAASPGVTSGTPPEGSGLGRALRTAGLEGGLPRLPFTRREAQAILSLVPAAQSKEALDFEANRATVTDPSLGDFRIVHFATHGFLNGAQPELSGIVLSLVDRQGDDASGFFTANDAFNLRLNAELVVLSGCRTALGKEMRGEGVVGLSRGFMYAGAPRVLASLWKVDDAATAELMKRLYRGVLRDGLAPAAALRAAQLDLMRRQRYRHPFYWAAFQLQGEWR